MSLLAGILFDATDALNPINLCRSVLKTLLPYSVVVIFYIIPVVFIISIFKNIPGVSERLEMNIFYPVMFLVYLLSSGVIFKIFFFSYFAMVASHMLGRFYWFNKGKLDWGL